MERAKGVTELLIRWGEGDQSALDALAPLVQSELRKIAQGYLGRERHGHTLQPTALVNEAWLRLVRQDRPSLENRRRFYALAAQVMRNVLVDYARRAGAGKRNAVLVPLESTIAGDGADLERLLALDEALRQLAQVSPRQARIVELRYFGGLDLDEIAQLLDVSPSTITRERQAAEAWLSRAVARP